MRLLRNNLLIGRDINICRRFPGFLFNSRSVDICLRHGGVMFLDDILFSDN